MNLLANPFPINDDTEILINYDDMQPCYTIKTYIIENKNIEPDLLESKPIIEKSFY